LYKELRIMTLPILLFQGGTHGNFLAKCLTVASGQEEDFDFYGDNKGAHNKKKLSRAVVEDVHPDTCDDIDIFVYVNIKLEDLYILQWHILFAGGDFGLDTLTVKHWDEIERAVNYYPAHEIVLNGFAEQVDAFKDSGTPGLRELFKRSMQLTNGLLTTQSGIYAKHRIQNTFEFAWFYDQPKFCAKVGELLVDLGYKYLVDVKHQQQEFVNRKQDILQSKKLVEQAFKCYTSKTSMDISNLCVYEQAYLDYLIEQHVGYTIENWQEYPTNTRNINPTEAWEGVRYEL